ncbi:MAG: AAA family ATPase [Planctomycetota bacterium]|nr:AAA family ATPase [Planctomycetota bacterium]
MPRVITIMNQKGGVGKTTTTLNLGAALAVRGQRVLLIDLDPQANLTHGLGLHANGLEESVYELLLGSDAVAEKLIKPTAWERLHLIPSHIDLSGAEIELVPVMGRETRLARALAPVRERYDFILIDCLPSLSLLTVNAMVAAGEALVPLQAHPFALEGLGKLFEVVGMLREALNPVLHVSGVLVTLYDSRTNVSRETLKRLQADPRLAPHLFNVLVRMNIKIAESQKDGIPVVHFDAACAGAKAYLRLADELLEMSRSQCLASESAGKLDAREPRKPARAARSPAKPGGESRRRRRRRCPRGALAGRTRGAGDRPGHGPSGARNRAARTRTRRAGRGLQSLPARARRRGSRSRSAAGASRRTRRRAASGPSRPRRRATRTQPAPAPAPGPLSRHAAAPLTPRIRPWNSATNRNSSSRRS